MFFFPVHSGFAQPAKDYSALLQEITTARNVFHESYIRADSTEKYNVVVKAREFLLNQITAEIFPQWYGTKWSFYGTTRIPRQGEIACGYFVTTVLDDAGFNIPRIEWAKSASEVFIKKLAAGNIKKFSDKSISEIENYLMKTGNGLYIAGLDNHVGFVWVDGDVVKFIHSNYYQPEIGVMSQEISSDNPFSNSRYRVIGKLFSDEMIINWINRTAYD